MELKELKRPNKGTYESIILEWLETGRILNKEIARELLNVLCYSMVVDRLRKLGYPIHTKHIAKCNYIYYLDYKREYKRVIKHTRKKVDIKINILGNGKNARAFRYMCTVDNFTNLEIVSKFKIDVGRILQVVRYSGCEVKLSKNISVESKKRFLIYSIVNREEIREKYGF